MEVYRILPLKSFFGYDSGRILKYVSNLLRNSLNLAAFPSNSSTSGVFLSLAHGASSGVDSGEIVLIRGRFFSLFLDSSGAGVDESSFFLSVSLLSLIASVINSRLGEGVLYSSCLRFLLSPHLQAVSSNLSILSAVFLIKVHVPKLWIGIPFLIPEVAFPSHYPIL